MDNPSTTETMTWRMFSADVQSVRDTVASVAEAVGVRVNRVTVTRRRFKDEMTVVIAGPTDKVQEFRKAMKPSSGWLGDFFNSLGS